MRTWRRAGAGTVARSKWTAEDYRRHREPPSDLPLIAQARRIEAAERRRVAEATALREQEQAQAEAARLAARATPEFRHRLAQATAALPGAVTAAAQAAAQFQAFLDTVPAMLETWTAHQRAYDSAVNTVRELTTLLEVREPSLASPRDYPARAAVRRFAKGAG
jgi:hypothetical protein